MLLVEQGHSYRAIASQLHLSKTTVNDIVKRHMAEDAMWFQAPPADYNAIITVMPMGNQLAFQYHKSYKEPLGSLRFFRCTGVGRWLLLHFNEMWQK